MCTHFWKQPAVHWGKEVSSLVGKGNGRWRRRNSTVVGKNKLSSYKTNREEIDRGSGRVCIIFKLFGFASLRKRFPFVTLPLHPFAVSRFACVVRHLSYWDGNSLRTNVSLFSVPFFLRFFRFWSASLLLASTNIYVDICLYNGVVTRKLTIGQSVVIPSVLMWVNESGGCQN